MGDAILKRGATRHQGGACRGAGRAGVKIGKTGTLAVEFVEVGRFEVGVTVAGEIAVSLVVGHH